MHMIKLRTDTDETQLLYKNRRLYVGVVRKLKPILLISVSTWYPILSYFNYISERKLALFFSWNYRIICGVFGGSFMSIVENNAPPQPPASLSAWGTITPQRSGRFLFEMIIEIAC
jgi:hypothetical protein